MAQLSWMNYTSLVGALSARIEAMSITRETIPVELAFIFVILAFVAGYSFRAVISKVRRAMTRARQAHRLGHSIRRFQPYTHCVSAPAAALQAQFWKIAQIQELRQLARN